MKAAHVLSALLLLPALAPLVEAAPLAEPKAGWFGPTGMLEGWHVRIPVQVTNPYPRALVDAVVTHELRLADVLMDAGWVTSRKGSSTLLESWEMDPASVRVVEYRGFSGAAAIDGVMAGEVASRVSLGLYDSTRVYNNRTQPDLHLEWVMPGVTHANTTRTFFIHVDTLANGRKDEPKHPERQSAPLENRGWVSRGTTLYGVAGRLVLVGLENETRAEVSIYSGGTPVPITSGAIPNPVPLNTGAVQVIPLGPKDVVVRILSNKPVIALGYAEFSDDFPDLGGPVPSANGGILGTEWLLPSIAAGGGYLVLTPGDPAAVTTVVGGMVDTFNLGAGMPLRPIPTNMQDLSAIPGTVRISSSAPVLVLSWPTGNTGRAQYPSIYGAPSGSRVVAFPYEGRVCGLNTGPSTTDDKDGTNCTPAPEPPCTWGNLEVKVTSSTTIATAQPGRATLLPAEGTPAVWARGRDYLTGALEWPTEGADRVSPLSRLVSSEPRSLTDLAEGDFRAKPIGSGQQTSGNSAVACPILFHATTDETSSTFHDAGDLVVFAGGNLPHMVGPLGSPDARDFRTYWPTMVIAHHNGTRVLVEQDGKVVLERPLGKGNAFRVDGGINNPFRIRATKPVVALPLSVPTGTTSLGGAGGWFVGFDDSLKAVPAGKPQYRGYLVSLEPSGLSTEPMTGLAAPGKAAVYKLLVRNLAKDDRGNFVPDTIDLGIVDGPGEGWTAELSRTTLRMGAGASEEILLKVNPPADVKENEKTRVLVAAVSQGNPRMSDRVQTLTTVRASYEVGIWFDREGAPAGKTLILDPDETKDVKVVVKNLAGVPDRVIVRSILGGPEWSARWGDSPSSVLDIPLEPGESRTLNLRLTAPAAKASQTVVTVTAVSGSDASAAAKQDATARVRAEVRIALHAAETVVEAPPGSQAVVRVEFENRGNDRVGIRFNTTGALPDGWSRPVIRQGDYEIDEISGIVPGTRVALDLVVPVPADAARGERANLHFFVETLPQFAGDPILREAVDVLVLAGARHVLTPVDPASTLSLGLEKEVRAQLVLDNAGNGDEKLRVIPREVPDGATVALGDLATVPLGDRGAVDLVVEFPTTTPPGTYRVAADVVSDDGHAVPWKFNVTVPERRAALLTPLGPARGIAGVEERLRVEVTNEGNTPLRTPPVILPPAGWTVEWEEDSRILSPGASAILALRLKAPADAPARMHTLELDPAWAHAEPLSWDLRTVALSADAARDGAGVAVKIRNDGTGDALQVDVLLLQGGNEVDRVVLQRIPPGGVSTALLAPRPGGGDLEVVVDNDARYAAAPLRPGISGAAPVNGMPDVAPGLLALALVGAALLARRLRRGG